MIITCPYCQTRYQVAAEAIGARGRQVQCAQCHRAWAATAQPERVLPRLVPQSPPLPTPKPETPLPEEEERQLDQGFDQGGIQPPNAPEEKVPQEDAHGGALDPAAMRKRQRAFFKRQNSLIRKLPMARMRRAARASAVVLLVAALAGGYLFRREMVSQFPAMAEIYATLGMPVNVIGLDLKDVSMVRAVRGGTSVLTVNYTLVSASTAPVLVPPVIVTLLDEHGASLLEWRVTPAVSDLLPGEQMSGSTQLTSPPVGAERLRLSFGSSRANSGGASTLSAAAESSHTAEPAKQMPDGQLSGATQANPVPKSALGAEVQGSHPDSLAHEDVPAGEVHGNGQGHQDVGPSHDEPSLVDTEHAEPADGGHHSETQEHH